MLLWRGWLYTIYDLYCHSVSPLSCGGCRCPLLMMGLVEERLVFLPCHLVGGLSFPLSYGLIEHGHMCQKGDPFRHHYRVSSLLTFFSRKLSPRFQLFDQLGKSFYRVIRPYHFQRIFFHVNCFYHPVSYE